MTEELIRRSASDVVTLLKRGDISPHDLLDALEARIAEVDGIVNALPTLCFDRARRHADSLVQHPPDRRGRLAGLPVPIKDLMAVKGVLNTMGSKAFEHNIAGHSDILVQRLESEGGVVYAMSNTPEFGAGGNTFNDVFGVTRNPHDLRLTPGGSSGGAAAAVASGMAWVAHGSDLAGSLRTPASFCGITSLRPSPGLFASGPSVAPFDVYGQDGPMARDVADLALLADAMAGQSHAAGLSKPRAAESFQQAVAQPLRPQRVAFSADLGISEPTAEVREAFDRAVTTLAADGMQTIQDHPDLHEAPAAFDVLRALRFAMVLGPHLARFESVFKPEVVWNVNEGLKLDGRQVRHAMEAAGRVFNAAAEFMRQVDLLVCPAVVVTPFVVEERYVGFGEGKPYSEYFRWLTLPAAVTVTTLPVITVPCGHTRNGMPVGIQLIGKPHGEFDLFRAAAHIESLFGFDTSVVNPSPANPAAAH